MPFEPSAANSTVPALIRLVGSAGNQPAVSMGQFSCTIRDPGNSPMPGVSVMIELGNYGELHLCGNQFDPNLRLNCTSEQASKTTDATGTVQFTLLGGSSGPAFTLAHRGLVYADGFLMGSPTIAAFDLDGTGGLGPNDLSVFLGDFASGQSYGRSDFDGSGGLGPNDLSIYLGAYASGTMIASCTASCPP